MSTITVDERKEKTAIMYERHAPVLTQLGVGQRDFIPKMPFFNSQGDQVIGLFESEAARKRDLYIEFADAEYEPCTEERKLFKYEYNPHFKTECENYQTSSNVTLYLVPIEELEEVGAKQGQMNFAPEKEKQVSLKKGSDKELPDAPMTELTIRDHIAISKGVPVSNKSWINDIVNEHLKE